LRICSSSIPTGRAFARVSSSSNASGAQLPPTTEMLATAMLSAGLTSADQASVIVPRK
jgi:hypothetical protein